MTMPRSGLWSEWQRQVKDQISGGEEARSSAEEGVSTSEASVTCWG